MDRPQTMSVPVAVAEAEPPSDYEEVLERFLERAAGLPDELQDLMRHHGFVIDMDLAKATAELSEPERWQKLAFTFYTEIVEMAVTAERLKLLRPVARVAEAFQMAGRP